LRAPDRTIDSEVIKEDPMADRFLCEISDLHQMRKEIRSLPDAAREDFMKRL